MRSKTKKVTAALLATSLFAFNGTAMATNGYFTHGVGTDSKGMAGSGVGSPSNVGGIAAATNPALAVFADEKWQVGLSLFSPMRSYTTSQSFAQGQGGAFTLSQGSHDSKNEAFPIPYFAKNWKLANDSALSFIFYGRGGMNTEWDSGQSVLTDPTGQGGAPATLPGLYGGGKAGVDLMQAFMSLNYAGQVNDRFAWGIGPVVAIQMFEAS
jgi:long-chain fatty acid transport protein